MVFSGHCAYSATLLLPPVPYNAHWPCITAPHTLILSASCTRVDFFSGIPRDILLRTKPFLVFYNSSPLAGARQWVQRNKKIPSQISAMTGNASTSAPSWIHNIAVMAWWLTDNTPVKNPKILKYQVYVVTVTNDCYIICYVGIISSNNKGL